MQKRPRPATWPARGVCALSPKTGPSILCWRELGWNGAWWARETNRASRLGRPAAWYELRWSCPGHWLAPNGIGSSTRSTTRTRIMTATDRDRSIWTGSPAIKLILLYHTFLQVSNRLSDFQYPRGDSNACTRLRRPVLYPTELRGPDARDIVPRFPPSVKWEVTPVLSHPP